MFTPDPNTQPQNQSSKPNPQSQSQTTITNDLIDISQPSSQTIDLLNDSPPKKSHPLFPSEIKPQQPISKSQALPSNSNKGQGQFPNWMDDNPFSPTALYELRQNSRRNNLNRSRSSVESRTPHASSFTGAASFMDNSPVRENLTGIYAFFGSRELPPNPKYELVN